MKILPEINIQAKGDIFNPVGKYWQQVFYFHYCGLPWSL